MKVQSQNSRIRQLKSRVREMYPESKFLKTEIGKNGLITIPFELPAGKKMYIKEMQHK